MGTFTGKISKGGHVTHLLMDPSADVNTKITEEEQKEIQESARCFSCQKEVTITDAESGKTANNRHRIFGKCSDCGKKVSKFIKKTE